MVVSPLLFLPVQGFDGRPGEKGDKGDMGIAKFGLKGNLGEKGEKGAQGALCPVVEPTELVIGPGPKGQKGEKGMIVSISFLILHSDEGNIRVD